MIVHLKKQEYDVKIDRTTIWGNPWSSKPSKIALFQVKTREEAVSCYRKWLRGEDFLEVKQEQRHLILKNIHKLRGLTLGCWCDPKKPCHGEVLKEILEEEIIYGSELKKTQISILELWETLQ